MTPLNWPRGHSRTECPLSPHFSVKTPLIPWVHSSISFPFTSQESMMLLFFLSLFSPNEPWLQLPLHCAGSWLSHFSGTECSLRGEEHGRSLVRFSTWRIGLRKRFLNGWMNFSHISLLFQSATLPGKEIRLFPLSELRLVPMVTL